MARWERMLIAIDEEDTSIKALRYVGRMARHMGGLTITLLHVFPGPPPGYFRNGQTLDEYRSVEEKRSLEIVTRAGRLLLEYDIPEEQLDYKVVMASDCTISEAVLNVQKEGGFGTVVVGKRGVSKAEEFLFGSISNMLARNCRDFCAWIVG